jgi:hypothetical protein
VNSRRLLPFASGLLLATGILAGAHASPVTNVVAPVAALDESNAQPDHFFTVTGMRVKIHRGKNLTLKGGSIVDLDPLRPFDCKSAAGCTINIESVMDVETRGDYTICSLIDGVPALPECELQQQTFHASTLQSSHVAKGPHTVQSQLDPNSSSGLVRYWQINYTLYEH